ncbi:oxygen-independent coproporphyrinogen-3 oxidase [Pseudoxanthobacter soli DSM 19599]|uniref:Heme chaperone HemW n=1 Tax=Pseudoxanthobacter soli DSM 19599 TaxID=1123029 RepID=A0A1M7ZJJ4_9HYPH|nr:radical SAM family heme chaperone HemW [Pseudoxanthobacter soli]SHO65080.1 oxygen-independent coproporphyrinogen-3 oxidase [Pseudoxanthobacter soli DSM 19599]
MDAAQVIGTQVTGTQVIDQTDRAAGGSGEGFGIYVHWPFCAAKCPYCDFNSHVRHKPVDQTRFARAFEAEIATAGARVPGRRVTSVFFGGGTPSLMEPSTVGTVLDAIAATWAVDADVEITLEANPSSVEAGRFAGYRAAGVNRVSLGVQALDDAPLRALGRIHDAAQARDAIAIAQRVFPRSSFDLIYARPGQTAAAWEEELGRALAMAGEHLSLYQLTIEPGTPFAALHEKGRLVTPPDDEAAALYELTQDICAAHGLPAYEISNHARPGAESRHNLVYWRTNDYVGVGPGAHGRLSQGNGRWATACERHPESWLERVERTGSGIIDETVLTAEETADEFLLMGLRLAEGIDLDRYAALGGRPVPAARLADFTEEGLILRRANGRIAATPRGRLVLNALVAALAA